VARAQSLFSTLPGTAQIGARERDLRLDFCRGVALIIIFIDHVPDNPLSNFTLRNFAFCDAAEIFVLISGMASYLAYGARFERDGFADCAKAIGKRWVRVYLAHLVLFSLVASLMVTASHYLFAADYIQWLNLNWLVEEPRRAIEAALMLSYLPRLVDILPLYVVLLGFAPPLIYLVKRDYRLSLLLSGIVYAVTWAWGLNLRAGRAREWYLDPFAWQFLYTLGMVICHLGRTARGKLRLGRFWLTAAIGFSLFAASLNAINGSASPSSYLGLADKTFLAPLRVINVLALVYVFGYFVAPQAPWLKSRLAQLFLACGRHSLPVYGLGVMLSCAGYVVIEEIGSRWSANLMVNLGGTLTLFSLAVLLDVRSRKRRAQNAPGLSSRNRFLPQLEEARMRPFPSR
jgi:hypothetical protein